ncbi:MAG: Asp-tRNA(Asn)/Glu-tRNA(Gln) amidotransferase GatCAB subunit C, partial [Actinobacteria bacterium]|nr:Asp-tRNA(Asn)/Glu-tRNA(Gln) amidotransferase GatCAB subunit C [Actinomycetota bacterium]
MPSPEPAATDQTSAARDERIAALVRDTVGAAPVHANRYRSTWAGLLTDDAVGQTPRVAGWVHRRRDHGGLIFVDLRDRSGLLQVVFDPATCGTDVFEAAERIRPEHVISAEGELTLRGAEHVNPKMLTGTVELRATTLDVLAEAETPPFPVDEDGPVDELLRLQHRVIDLRRERTRDALLLRSRIVRAIRDAMEDEGFLDVETPYL